MSAYYNEIDPYAAEWLRRLQCEGLIADGEIDTRSIVDVRADDVRGFTQCHWFAGIGGWSLALRLAGWTDDRPVWTGSCPCGPFSLAGGMERFTDERHLWPNWIPLIEKCRPAVVFGEQVASATEWLRLVQGDLEALDYTVGATSIEAASAGAFHLRDRFWLVADRDLDDEQRAGARHGRGGEPSSSGHDAGGRGPVVDSVGSGLEGLAGDGDRGAGRPQPSRPVAAAGDDLDGRYGWVVGLDGKRRIVESGVRLLADGVSFRVDKLRALGNAIDPRPAAAFIAAYMDCRP